MYKCPYLSWYMMSGQSYWRAIYTVMRTRAPARCGSDARVPVSLAPLEDFGGQSHEGPSSRLRRRCCIPGPRAVDDLARGAIERLAPILSSLNPAPLQQTLR